MRALILTACVILLAACGRPMTENEVAFATALHGDTVNPARVRFHDGLVAGSFTYQRPVRPRLSCSERIFPPSRGETVTVSPGAAVLFNRVFYRRDLYRDDFMKGFPDRIDLLDAMMFAHEMVHVWQWQNRARTKYHPLKGAGEHSGNPDPYLFDVENTARFLDYGYEQQGAIMEEYVCCRLLDPDAPRTARLREMISAEMPLNGLDRAISRPRVRLPWPGAKTRGICR
ncbi:basic secretory family protein [Lutimaribacter sp. EGI FJ00015]|uniref:Basic secretory family protein n=1 Tax=Lutimaribacter degradans TaxID=2945989 RepID=A0ACC6A0Y0_9RHOB|nr:basic secretory family protein [Lutimaribacter sp. EGI FJ00013]MCM2563838.1 basic secretory family protein [Lutimaribacter sp. EGI FJ00013]MCO0615007.1 basic secretory family protein [Lutimaribacter sp. EGI FJ00015]MCO0637671.1 basic secretory family protein [Lutimaribacter sp. EGI FJ00014]